MKLNVKWNDDHFDEINAEFDSNDTTEESLDNFCFAISSILNRVSKQLFPEIVNERKKELIEVYTMIIQEQFEFICDNEYCEDTEDNEQKLYDDIVVIYNEWLEDSIYESEDELFSKFLGFNEKELKLSFKIKDNVVSSYLGEVELALISTELLDDEKEKSYYIVKNMMLMRVIFDRLFADYDDDERFSLDYVNGLLLEILN